MRILSLLVLLSSISLVPTAQASLPLVVSDISAGVLRFQTKLAEKGNPEAQYKVGEMYEMGKGAPKNIATAKSWYEKAAAQGHKKAGYKILNLEIKQNGLNDFNKTQLGVLRQEAASGNPDAQYFLGKMYAEGTGVPKSLKNASTWLNKARFNGVPEAEHEAIMVDEKLARQQESAARQKAKKQEEAKRKKAEEEKARKAKEAAERKRKADDAKRRQAEQERRKVAQDRKRVEAERAAKQREQQRLEAQRAKQAQQETAKTEEAPKGPAEFESDPCKGKKAKFLSICR